MISLVDSFAVPVCGFAKAPRCRSFAGIASNGYDAMSKAVCYGFEGYLRVCWLGAIVAGSFALADVPARWVVESDLLSLKASAAGGGGEEGGGTWLVGDTDYWSPILREDLERHGINLLTPKKTSVKRALPLARVVYDLTTP